MLLEDIKLALRITNAAFDSEINGLIGAAVVDLILAGVSEEKANDNSDPLINRAITIYSKANFGLDNPDSEKYQKSYDSLKMHLTLAADYKAVVA